MNSSTSIEYGPGPNSLTVTWHSPDDLASAARTMSGQEFLIGIKDRTIPPPPMAQLIGASLIEVADGEVTFEWTPHESTYNTLHIVHGGLLCTLLDFAAGAAVHSALPAAVGFTSIEIKVSYLRALRVGSGNVTVHGRTLDVRRRVAFAEAHAYNTAGEIVGHATTTLALARD